MRDFFRVDSTERANRPRRAIRSQLVVITPSAARKGRKDEGIASATGRRSDSRVEFRERERETRRQLRRKFRSAVFPPCDSPPTDWYRRETGREERERKRKNPVRRDSRAGYTWFATYTYRRAGATESWRAASLSIGRGNWNGHNYRAREKHFVSRGEIHVAIILTVRATLTCKLRNDVCVRTRSDKRTDRREETRDTETANPRRREATPGPWYRRSVRFHAVRERHATAVHRRVTVKWLWRHDTSRFAIVSIDFERRWWSRNASRLVRIAPYFSWLLPSKSEFSAREWSNRECLVEYRTFCRT